MFPDEQSARDWLESIRWQHGRTCPSCKSTRTTRIKSEKPMPYRCQDCRKHFSVRTGSITHRSKIPLRKWVIAIYLLSTNIKGVSSMRLHRELGVTQKTAWLMAQKIRQGWDSGSAMLKGEVEVDEAYFGGKEKNKHANKRHRAGRGSVSKEAIVGIKQRRGWIRTKHVQYTTAQTLQGMIHKHVKPGSAVYTDEHRGYQGVGDLFFRHATERHSTGQYVDGRAHTNGIESFWALMKRGYHGTYHKMSPKHLHRYIAEFAGRHNVRGFDTIDQMTQMVKTFDGKRMTYRDLIRENGLDNAAR